MKTKTTHQKKAVKIYRRRDIEAETRNNPAKVSSHISTKGNLYADIKHSLRLLNHADHIHIATIESVFESDQDLFDGYDLVSYEEE